MKSPVLSPSQRTRAALALAGLWGFAEATLFFIVPDVLLSWLALRRANTAWKACIAATIGALFGGAAMFLWGSIDHASAVAVLDRVPAVHRPMIESVAKELEERGPLALFIGPLTGRPYKIYAVHGGHRGMHAGLFLAVSVPARLARFVIITAIAAGLCALLPRVPLAVRRIIHAALWLSFYAWYFAHLGL